MKFRSSKTIKREFLESRTPQSDDDFLEGCRLGDDASKDALAIRSVIANLGGVDPGYVWAEDLFERELLHFDFWGSLNSVTLVMELEECLDVQIPDKIAQKIPDPDRTPGITVARFVQSVLLAVGKIKEEG